MRLLSGLIGNRLFSAVTLFLISFALFSPSLGSDFVWDDVEVITKSNVSFEASNIARVIVPGIEKNKKERYYRPVIYASMVLDNGLWGVTPFGFHLSNLVFHALSTVLFYFMAVLVLNGFRVEGSGAGAFLAALLFAVHPMHVESVSWVAGRTDALCAVFLFLAFIMHILSYGRTWLLALVAAGFALSLMSKETAVAFPLLALSYDLLGRRLKDRTNIARYAVYMGILVLYFYLRGRAFVNVPELSAGAGGSGVSFAARGLEPLITVLGSYLAYLNKLILPVEFNAFITNVPRGIVYTLSSMILLAALAVLGFWSVKKRENVTAFSILWVLITLGPAAVVSITGIASTPLAERYLYIPSAGFCLLLGYWISEAAERARVRRIAWGLALILVVAYAALSYQRQGVWRDDLSLWRDTALKSPAHPLPHSNYGLALSNAGQGDMAIGEFELALSPEMNDSPRGKAVTANNLGLEYLQRERYTEAEGWFRKALEYDPGYGRTYYHMGLINFIKGDLTGSAAAYEDAERYLKKVFDHYHTFGRANLLLAKVYLKTGEIDKAREQAEEAIRSGLPENLSGEARDILVIDNESGNGKP